MYRKDVVCYQKKDKGFGNVLQLPIKVDYKKNGALPKQVNFCNYKIILAQFSLKKKIFCKN
jgi:hypothetical protein